MQLFELSANGRTQISAARPGTAAEPLLVYLGCLHHVQGIDTGTQTFIDYIQQLRAKSNARVVMPTDEDTNFPSLMHIREAFNTPGAPPSPLAEFVYETIFATAIDSCPDIYDPLSRKRLQRSLQNTSIFGYSYGTSLLQQVGVVMADRLAARHSPDSTRGQHIAEICQSVKAVTIGPVSRLHQIHADGSTAPVRYDDAGFGAAETLFTHASFLLRQDRIVQRSYGDECLDGRLTSDTGIETRGAHAMRLIIDYTENPTRKALGFKQAATGEILPEIIQSTDPVVHHPRLYTNTGEKLGNLRVFPASAIGGLFRQALDDMLQPERKADDWLAAITAKVDTQEKRCALIDAFRATCREYESNAHTAKSLPPGEAGMYLKQYVEQADAASIENTLQVLSVQQPSGYEPDTLRFAA